MFCSYDGNALIFRGSTLTLPIGNMKVLYLFCVFLLQQVHGKAKAGQVVKEDLPYIACDVCEASINELYSATQSARSLQPKNKLDEVDIVVLIESICNPASTTGEWIRKIDIIESTLKDKRVLSLIEPGGLAKCGNECATIAKSCQNLLHEEIDADELSALLWKNKSSLDEVKVGTNVYAKRMVKDLSFT